MGSFAAQLSEKISPFRVASLRNRCPRGPQLAALLNGTRKTEASTSSVKRQLQDVGLKGRVAMKKPYLRPANKIKKIHMGIYLSMDG